MTDLKQDLNIDTAFLDRLIAQHGTGADAAIPILQDIQTRWRYLPREALWHICENTCIAPAQLTGVATFYSQFRHRGTGQHLVQVCHGTACHVAGAQRVTDSLRRHLDLNDHTQDTSSDGLFTIERVACLGCCTLAPVMLIDGIAYGHLTPSRASDSLETFLKDEAAGLHGHQREKERIVESLQALRQDGAFEIRVGLNSCCIANGSRKVCDSLVEAAKATGRNVKVKPVGCTGMCHRVPLVELVGPDGATLYGDNNPRTARKIIRQRIRPRGIWRRVKSAVASAADFLTSDEAPDHFEENVIEPNSGEGGEFLAPQVRLVTEQCGVIDPLDLDEYVAIAGYEALRSCVTDLNPEQVIDTIGRSGLRGRGGAGFPVAQKWRAVKGAPGEIKYVICNGDEGDPGAFMDRMILES
ncbi:NAD(P)H-dependent oxidoreductase subunit E, partial [bacterium]|nr:NAD(P)H-dependent oxidoreductase subunit E [bacterium]